MIPELPVQASVVQLLSRLQSAGHQAYIVGGAVRDLLLNIEPKDYDIATSATPEEIRSIFRRQARIIGRRFRLVHVRYGQALYEVSTFRREPTPEERTTRHGDDGVLLWNDNQYGNREQDATRRDFTINAIFYNPLGQGEMIDCVNGLADLEEGMVRTIGEPRVRLAEDPVRILRALKLVAQYDFKLEAKLESMIRRQGVEISLASSARLYEELLKIFDKPYTVKTLAVFREFEFLRHFLPRIDHLWDHECGLQMRRLTAGRDRRKSQGSYWKSRRLALATMALPIVLHELGIADPREGCEMPSESDRLIRNTVKNIFQPLVLPNALVGDVKELLRLFPRFFEKRQINRVVKNPQYRWTHELFSLCIEVFGWEPALLEGWPPADYGPPPPRSRGRRPRRRRPRDNNQRPTGPKSD